MKNSEAILVTPKHFEIQECPVPEPKDHEILMKVEYVGMCGSDIHGFEFGPFIPPKDPNQKIGLGHEVAGEVVKIGAKVTKFKVGDKVLIEPGVPDDTCDRPEAIFACNDMTAFNIYRACYILGLRIPDHLSVFGYDDCIMANFVTPPLSTVSIPVRKLAGTAIDFIHGYLESGVRAELPILKASLIIRNSVRNLNLD